MKLSNKSWHAMSYKMTFPEHDLPDNLCPYFWKVMLSVVVFIVLGWFCLPAYLIQRIHDARVKKQWDKWAWSEEGFFSEFFGIAFCTNLALYIFTSLFMVWKDFTDKTWLVGFVIFCMVALAAIVFLILEKRKKIIAKRPRKEYEEKPYKEPTPNIFIEFIKAKYKRYCPKIRWKEKLEQS